MLIQSELRRTFPSYCIKTRVVLQCFLHWVATLILYQIIIDPENNSDDNSENVSEDNSDNMETEVNSDAESV